MTPAAPSTHTIECVVSGHLEPVRNSLRSTSINNQAPLPVLDIYEKESDFGVQYPNGHPPRVLRVFRFRFPVSCISTTQQTDSKPKRTQVRTFISIFKHRVPRTPSYEGPGQDTGGTVGHAQRLQLVLR